MSPGEDARGPKLFQGRSVLEPRRGEVGFEGGREREVEDRRPVYTIED